MLSILRLLGILQVAYYIFLQLSWQVHVLHGCICQINGILKLCVLQVEILNDQCHVTKDVRIYDSAKEDCCGAEEDLPLPQRRDVIASQQKDGIVNGYQVLSNH